MYRYNSERSEFRFRSGERLSLIGMLVRLVDNVAIARERRKQRRALARLDDRLLRDIGLSAADVEGEVSKPFWR